MLRIIASLAALGLALAVGIGCSRSGEGGASGQPETVQPRRLPEIWLDLIAQRDEIQRAIGKGTEMWHEDCAAVSAGAAKIDALVLEMSQRFADMPSLADRRRQTADVVARFQALLTDLSRAADEETIGLMPNLMINLDAFMHGVEGVFTPEEIGSESVATHPGFNPILPPPPDSPV